MAPFVSPSTVCGQNWSPRQWKQAWMAATEGAIDALRPSPRSRLPLLQELLGRPQQGDLAALDLEDVDAGGLHVPVGLELDALRHAVVALRLVGVDVVEQLGPRRVSRLDAVDEDVGRVVALGGVRAGVLPVERLVRPVEVAERARRVGRRQVARARDLGALPARGTRGGDETGVERAVTREE